MANRQQAVPAQVREGAGENTARVVVHKSSLPGWFWGAAGCLSVLAVGFGILLFVVKNGVLDGAVPGPSSPPTAAALAGAAATPGGPQIEQLAAPAPPPLAPVQQKQRALPHPLKLARSPSLAHALAAKPEAPAATPEAPAVKAEAPAAAEEATPAKKPADKPAAGDDDQVVHVHHTTASDDDDDDSDN